MVVATWSDIALALGELGVGCRDILNHFVVGRLIEPAEVIENIRSRRRLLADVTEFGDRGLVDARADEDLKNVLGIDIDIRPEIHGDGCVRFVR